MPPKIEVNPVKCIPEDGNVRDYDELPEDAKNQFLELISRERSPLNNREFSVNAIESCQCDIINFVNYYKIKRHSQEPLRDKD